MGRTGAWFACEHGGVLPDVLTVAKALGNGVPIGACLARGTAAGLMHPGNHGTTFGGNPLAARAALAVIEAIERDDLVNHADRLGQQMLEGFRERLGGVHGVREIRGLGLMIGIELDRPCAALVKRALDRGLLINVTAERVIRLLPPMVTTAHQGQTIVDKVSELVREFLAE
jgi:acetylornithine/N-succinyldiaminopimelate aminotransferase